MVENVEESMDFLRVAQAALEQYFEHTGCRWCKDSARDIIEAIDELIALHGKAKDFLDVLGSNKKLLALRDLHAEETDSR